MLLGTARSVGESHRDVDAALPEVLGDAIGARHVRRHEIALHADADGVDRPRPANRCGKLSMMTSTSRFAADASTMPPPMTGGPLRMPFGASGVGVPIEFSQFPQHMIPSIAARMCEVVHNLRRHPIAAATLRRNGSIATDMGSRPMLSPSTSARTWRSLSIVTRVACRCDTLRQRHIAAVAESRHDPGQAFPMAHVADQDQIELAVAGIGAGASINPSPAPSKLQSSSHHIVDSPPHRRRSGCDTGAACRSTS